MKNPREHSNIHIGPQDAENIYLSPAEAARLLLVSPVTLRTWAQKGLLPSETTPGGHRRFLRRDVEQFLRDRKVQRLNSPPRVLVVEDDVQMMDYLLELLPEMSHPLVVETAHDGFEAGSKLLSFAPDVMLLDLMMPGMNGFDVCHRVKSDPATAAIRVIAMTGYPTEENIRKILAAGAEHCLSKPVDVGQLAQILFG
jgi:excisionase family DNA binding protein